MDKESLAQEYVENLLDLLSDENSQLSATALLDEVFLLLDDYKDDQKVEESIEQRNTLLEETSEAPSANILKPINRGFILDKATKNYLKENNLTDETFTALNPADKLKHRKGITDLFNKLLLEESEKPTKTSKLFDSPFKIIKRAEEEANIDTVTDAETKWYKAQIVEIKQKIRLCNAETQELQRQNKIDQISGHIISRNENRIEEINQENEKYKLDLKFYQEKLSEL